MKVVIAPDKFKGSLTTFDVCKAIAAGIRSVDPSVETLSFPMADGGDGFAAVMKYYQHTTTVTCSTEDPLGRPVTASYELKGDTAIIELASASGLMLLKEDERNALKTSTYGTGRMIKDAVTAGARKIILGLGGSATNDAGTGILAALGFQLKDKDGHTIKACGENLIHIDHIIPPPEYPDIKFEIACDVQNTLYGPQGAAFVYAPQKGASPEGIQLLDAGLRNFAEVIKRQYHKDVAGIPGAGAAGGIAAGLMGCWEVRLIKGIEWIMDTSGIKDILPEADLVITGEGKIDKQSLYGKVVAEISLLAKKYHIPVVAFCGASDIQDADRRQLNLQTVRVITPAGMPAKEAMAHADKLLVKQAAEYFGTISP